MLGIKNIILIFITNVVCEVGWTAALAASSADRFSSQSPVKVRAEIIGTLLVAASAAATLRRSFRERIGST